MAPDDASAAHSTATVDHNHLRAFVERIEHLNEEIGALNEDKAEIFKEAKGSGFDTKILKKVIALRRLDRDKRMEEAEILDLYMTALGMAQ